MKVLALIYLAPVAIVLLGTEGAIGQDCKSMSDPARTDCFIGQTRIYGQKSEIAGRTDRVRISQERLRSVTGGVYVPKPRKAKSHHRP
jgi:hypothetical protein